MPVVARALAWDTSTPTPIISYLECNPAWAGADLDLISHPNATQPAPVTTRAAYFDFGRSVRRPGVSDTALARAAAAVNTYTLLSYCDPPGPVHPLVLDELATRAEAGDDPGDAEGDAQHAMLLAATHASATLDTRLRALRVAAALPQLAFRPTHIARLITAATRLPDHLDELAARARTSGNALAAPLTDLAAPHADGLDAHARWLRDLHDSAVTPRANLTASAPAFIDTPQGWAHALGATDDAQFADQALISQPGHVGNATAIVNNPSLNDTSAHWRAHAMVYSPANGSPTVTTARQYQLDRIRLDAREMEVLSSAWEDTDRDDIDPAFLDALWDAFSRMTPLVPLFMGDVNTCAAWALHPHALPWHKAHFAALTRKTIVMLPGTSKTYLTTLSRLNDGVSVADIPLPDLTYCLRHTTLETTALELIAQVLRPHHGALADPRTLATILALEVGFAGTLSELLETTTTILAA